LCFCILDAHANFVCVSNSSGSAEETVYAASDVRAFYSNTIVSVSAHFSSFAGATAPGNPPALGYNYFGLTAAGNQNINNSFAIATVDGLGAFWTALYAFEFFPGPNDGGAYNPATAKLTGAVYNFTSFTVQGCQSTPQSTNASIMVHTLTFVDSNGWILSCRVSSDKTLDLNGNVISPSDAKCDVTFGNFPYKNTTGSRLGFVTVFIIAGFAAHVSTNPSVYPCASDPGSFCLTTESSSYAGKFAFVKTTQNGKGIVASGISAYTGAAGVFNIPSTPNSVGAANGSIQLTAVAFEAASIVVFSVDHPAPGDVWDPKISVGQKSTIDPKATSSKTTSSKKSSSSTVVYNLFLIVAALLFKFL